MASQVLLALEKLAHLGVTEVALADTYGVASAAQIDRLLAEVLPQAPPVKLGLHLHSRPDQCLEKVEIALDHGIDWLEGALDGQGGCPFAGDEQVGNLPTELVWPLLVQRGLLPALRHPEQRLAQARDLKGRFHP